MVTEDSEHQWGMGRRGFLQSTALAGLGAALFSGSATAQSRGRGQSTGAYRSQLTETHQLRKDAARAQLLNVSVPSYETPERVDGFVGSFTKGLPHNEFGEVDTDAYETLVAAVEGETAFENVPLAGDRKLVNPSASQSRTMTGPGTVLGPLPGYPAFESAEAATEMVELYWMALARDVPFSQFESDATVQAAADELAALGAESYEMATDPSTVFRGTVQGATEGPYVSQFLYKDIPRGNERQDQKRRAYQPGEDFVTEYDEWLSIQRGEAPSAETTLTDARYITTPRDLATYVDGNLPGKMFRNAALILFDMGVPLDDGVPDSAVETSTIDYKQMQIPSAVPAVIEQVIRYTWFNKWRLHRRARPEVLAGRVHVGTAEDNDRSYPLDASLLESEAVARTREAYGTALLPQAYPQASPLHPSYPAGHSTIAGACTTVLKALFDVDRPIEDPVAPSDDGETLESIDESLTVEGELNKLATNNARGRDFAGIHYYSDGLEGIRGGEQFAIEWLQDRLQPIRGDATLSLTTVDGEEVTIEPTTE